ncbi:MAG TPA: nuclear transport factor 2 family protein [Acetobacteraceae bacterium]|jgi:ketosteroid isomerase-like protein|nr:nuclear transport factor 2 family protein [Acetobacteraceae bacterium]
MDDLVAAEQALYCAMIAQDFAALHALLADDLVYIHSTAVAEDKRGYLEGVRNGLYDYGAIESRDVTIRICGDVAIQTGIVAMSVAARGEAKAETTLLFTLVWLREQQGWRLWQRQATRVP